MWKQNFCSSYTYQNVKIIHKNTRKNEKYIKNCILHRERSNIYIINTKKNVVRRNIMFSHLKYLQSLPIFQFYYENKLYIWYVIYIFSTTHLFGLFCIIRNIIFANNFPFCITVLICYVLDDTLHQFSTSHIIIYSWYVYHQKGCSYICFNTHSHTHNSLCWLCCQGF